MKKLGTAVLNEWPLSGTWIAGLNVRCGRSSTIPHSRERSSRLREVLTLVFEFSNLIEQQRTGVITRQLAAWAAILAVPTAIADIYGMNFEHMPELRSPYGYPITLGVILTICSVLYWRFRRTRWL